ncbi:GDSL-type esterase/lipase family protein [Actinoplanes sp. HUAS TT8]|uniref:GDSL-type esterase/lipase family protein n=1 Tax=Actinoplanes sp. HUAS TT8 TaxID=3447453 RepID=UPI003F528358
MINPEFVHGAAELETTARGLKPHRLPAWVRERFPDPQLTMTESQPSGVRVVVATTARTLRMVCHATRVGYVGAERPRGAVDLVIGDEIVATDRLTGGDLVAVDLRTGATEFRPGDAHTASFDGLPAGDKIVELWLPHNETVELIELSADEPVRPVVTGKKLWVHHGSSISHGSNAASPARIWPAVAARRAGVELRNLGLGGSALVDPFTARVIRDAPADLISVKLGINVVNLDGMRLRTFVPAVHGFLDTIREAHPRTPLMVISSIFCGIHEDTPGPGAIDPDSVGTEQIRFVATGRTGDTELGRLTLRVIRDALSSLVQRRADDPNLHYLDGTLLYGEKDAAGHPLPDALHPDTATHQLIGERFAEHTFGAGGPFRTR